MVNVCKIERGLGRIRTSVLTIKSVIVYNYVFFVHYSGVTQVLAQARGLTVKAWLVMTVISVHVETRVAVVSVPPRRSAVTVSVSSVMATAAASRLALGLSTASALVG